MTRIYKYCAAIICALFFATATQTATVKAQNATFVVSGVGVPDSIMSVVEHCATVWSEYVYSSVPINVSVSWLELKSNVNAYAKPTNAYEINEVYYPTALAEKIEGKNLNGTDADIEVAINNTLKWYVETDKVPESLPRGVYDLTTTLLHEFAHGLGYIGNIESDNETKILPMIFDMFVSDSAGNAIISKEGDTYSLDVALLKSDSLYWNGSFATAFCGQKLKLFAPSKFNSGSTVYHLDTALYHTGSGFELMRAVLEKNEFVRKPDLPTIAMLADIGWNEYFIKHTIPQNTSDFQSNTKLSFWMKDTLLQKDQQTIEYSFDGGRHVVELPALYDDESQVFTAEIPAMAFDHTISYRIRSITSNDDTLFFPEQYPEMFFSVFIGDDVEAPVIEHQPLKSAKATVNETTADIVFTADITDNFEIDSAYVEYYLGKEKQTFILKFPNKSEYKVVLSFPPGANYTENDVLHYRIVAVDESGNIGYSNNGEYFEVPFEYPLDPVSYFMTDFDNEDIDNYFRLDKCSISKENGFENKALHTAHPYVYSGLSNKYVQYTATIKQPIVIADNPAIMTFDEVVLVEPGKVGIPFGTFGFWDYVVVEGSKDEENWYALGKKGWDSQLWNDWYQQYHSQKTNDGKNENSLAVGNSTLFKKHTINLLENKYFRAGDTIFVRFRMQSDETNYAWGWAIDNLKIQERIALPIIPLAMTNIELYPNPTSDMLYIFCDNFVIVEVFDVTGVSKLKSSQNTISVAHFDAGMYFAKITLLSGEVIVKQFMKK